MNVGHWPWYFKINWYFSNSTDSYTDKSVMFNIKTCWTRKKPIMGYHYRTNGNRRVKFNGYHMFRKTQYNTHSLKDYAIIKRYYSKYKLKVKKYIKILYTDKISSIILLIIICIYYLINSVDLYAMFSPDHITETPEDIPSTAEEIPSTAENVDFPKEEIQEDKEKDVEEPTKKEMKDYIEMSNLYAEAWRNIQNVNPIKGLDYLMKTIGAYERGYTMEKFYSFLSNYTQDEINDRYESLADKFCEEGYPDYEFLATAQLFNDLLEENGRKEEAMSVYKTWFGECSPKLEKELLEGLINLKDDIHDTGTQTEQAMVDVSVQTDEIKTTDVSTQTPESKRPIEYVLIGFLLGVVFVCLISDISSYINSRIASKKKKVPTPEKDSLKNSNHNSNSDSDSESESDSE